jgi:hypothetical protein
MHLLRTDSYELVYVSGKPPPYAILSHRWESQEITFKTLDPKALRNLDSSTVSKDFRASAEKIRGSCRVARQQGFDHVWIDTVCIDKSSSEELRVALSSMFKWYREAAICHAYLNDVTFFQIGEHYADMFCSNNESRKGQPSEWFERGWTLQELLAPRKLEFYDKSWNWIGTRDQLAPIVGKVAGISADYLRDPRDGGTGKARFREASIATKMSWMAGRRTTAVEDIAYSMLGIFNVDLTPRYGEGVRAFTRLQAVILLNWGTFDESLFAWECPPDGLLRCYRNWDTIPTFKENVWGLLAPSPDCFSKSANIVVIPHKVVQRLGDGFTRSNHGVAVTLGIWEVKSKMFSTTKSEIALPLNCWMMRGQVREAVVLSLSRVSGTSYRRTQCTRLSYQQGAKVGNNRFGGQDQLHTVAVAIPQPQLELD